MGMVWEPKSSYSKSERRNGGGEGVCCSGEGSTEEEIGWNTPSLIKLLMGHQFLEQDSQWVGKESEEKSESGGWTKMAENSSSMDWLVQDLMVGEEQDMNAMVQQRQNDNMYWQHANSACMAMAPSTQSASLAFSKLLGLPSSSPNQFVDSKPLHFHTSLFDSHSNPPLPFLPYSSPLKPSPPLIKLQPSASDSREPGRKRARITPSVSCVPGIRRSSNSDPSKPKRTGSRNPACHALNTNLKPRAKQGCANDPQSIAARQRRERISERLKILQDLIPNGSKVDLVTMLEKAINYVKFLQLQVKVLMNDEFWATQQEQENPDQPSSDITSSHEYNGSM